MFYMDHFNGNFFTSCDRNIREDEKVLIEIKNE
jgi:hypothetical protein